MGSVFVSLLCLAFVMNMKKTEIKDEGTRELPKEFFSAEKKELRENTNNVYHNTSEQKESFETEAINEREKNQFFFNERRLEYNGYIRPLSANTVLYNVYLDINVVKTFDDGTLYTLELEQLEVEDPEDEITMGGRYLGYFFVTKDTIYCKSVNFNGYTEENTDEAIKIIQERGEAFSEYFVIVCNEEGTKDVVDDNDYHEFVAVDGDRRIFTLRNDYVSGTREYLTIMWEKGKGMVYYEHGSGARKMHVEIWRGNVVIKWFYE